MPSPNDDIVVLSGGIGAGKSTAAAMFGQLGAVVISADSLARQVLAANTAAHRQVVENFGTGILNDQGGIDRKKLAEEVFAKPEQRKLLERITHPKIQALAQQGFARARKERPPLILYDCPLYFEAGLEQRGFGAVVVIAAERKLCIERVRQREGCPAEAVEARMAAQMPLEEKIRRADYVLLNDKGLEELQLRVEELFDLLAKKMP